MYFLFINKKTAFQRWSAYTRVAQSTLLQFPWQFSVSQTGCRTVRDDCDRLLEVDLDVAVGQFLHRFLPEQLGLGLPARREALLLVPMPLCPRWCITGPTKQHLISNQVVSPLCNLKSNHLQCLANNIVIRPRGLTSLASLIRPSGCNLHVK